MPASTSFALTVTRTVMHRKVDVSKQQFIAITIAVSSAPCSTYCAASDDEGSLHFGCIGTNGINFSVINARDGFGLIANIGFWAAHR